MSCVLVVEDDASIRDSLVEVLRYEGYQVRDACNGAEALKAVHETTPDLILLDLMMPVMDGPTFVKAWHNDPYCQETPVIVMSAAPNLPDKAKQLRADGVRACLAKPFDLDALIALVGHYVPLPH